MAKGSTTKSIMLSPRECLNTFSKADIETLIGDLFTKSTVPISSGAHLSPIPFHLILDSQARIKFSRHRDRETLQGNTFPEVWALCGFQPGTHHREANSSWYMHASPESSVLVTDKQMAWLSRTRWSPP